MPVGNNYGLPALGAGIGLRRQHLRDVIVAGADVGWFEVIPENFLGRGGFCADALRRISASYRVIGHGVAMSIGSTDPLDLDHVDRIKALCDALDAPWFSDHLCSRWWTMSTLMT